MYGGHSQIVHAIRERAITKLIRARRKVRGGFSSVLAFKPCHVYLLRKVSMYYTFVLTIDYLVGLILAQGLHA